jgi:hypothetical protein
MICGSKVILSKPIIIEPSIDSVCLLIPPVSLFVKSKEEEQYTNDAYPQ